LMLHELISFFSLVTLGMALIAVVAVINARQPTKEEAAAMMPKIMRNGQVDAGLLADMILSWEGSSITDRAEAEAKANEMAPRINARLASGGGIRGKRQAKPDWRNFTEAQRAAALAEIMNIDGKTVNIQAFANKMMANGKTEAEALAAARRVAPMIEARIANRGKRQARPDWRNFTKEQRAAALAEIMNPDGTVNIQAFANKMMAGGKTEAEALAGARRVAPMIEARLANESNRGKRQVKGQDYRTYTPEQRASMMRKILNDDGLTVSVSRFAEQMMIYSDTGYDEAMAASARIAPRINARLAAERG
jgi:hypothetical protein